MKVKAYTDLEQSKKLAEILPLKSADMCYEFDWDLDMNTKYKSTPIIIEKSNHFELYSQDIPCWSLSALLGVLPKSVRLVGTPKDSYWYCECVDDNNQWYAGFGSADNPIDACYEMIMKLHEQKLI